MPHKLKPMNVTYAASAEDVKNWIEEYQHPPGKFISHWGSVMNEEDGPEFFRIFGYTKTLIIPYDIYLQCKLVKSYPYPTYAYTWGS